MQSICEYSVSKCLMLQKCRLIEAVVLLLFLRKSNLVVDENPLKYIISSSKCFWQPTLMSLNVSVESGTHANRTNGSQACAEREKSSWAELQEPPRKAHVESQSWKCIVPFVSNSSWACLGAKGQPLLHPITVTSSTDSIVSWQMWPSHPWADQQQLCTMGAASWVLVWAALHTAAKRGVSF